MKKPMIPLLVLVTGLFAAFSLGFFVGRNTGNTPVQLSIPQIQKTTQATEPTETTVPNVAELQAGSPASVSAEITSCALININTASAEELELQLQGNVIG